MSTALAGLRVLITRPIERADSLLQAISAEGGEAISVPLLAISPLDPVADARRISFSKACIDNLQSYQHLIFISTNAVGYAMPWLNSRWPQLPAGCRCHAIGAATAEAMLAEGLPVAAVATAMNSESLLKEPSLIKLDGERVLIFRGVGGREYLGEQLRKRGAEVDYAECYRRSAIAVAKPELRAVLEQHRVNCLHVSSGETLQALDGAADETIRLLPLVVPSQRVAQQAEDLGFKQVVVAANAGVTATLSALCELRANREFSTS